MAFIGFKAIFSREGEAMSAHPSGSEPRRLPECSEARGQLLRIFESEGQVVGVWAWGCCSFPAELRGKLAPLVGRTVAVLRLDGYHVREVGP